MLQLLGDFGFDLLLRGITRQYNKKQLAVTQAYFYSVSKCWNVFKHQDFTSNGESSLNVLIPIKLPDSFASYVTVWDDRDGQGSCPKDILKGDYHFNLDEAVIIGEEVYHSTGKSKKTISVIPRVMLCICAQDCSDFKFANNRINQGWVHKEAFPCHMESI